MNTYLIFRFFLEIGRNFLLTRMYFFITKKWLQHHQFGVERLAEVSKPVGIPSSLMTCAVIRSLVLGCNYSMYLFRLTVKRLFLLKGLVLYSVFQL